jgi:hypothetical protein
MHDGPWRIVTVSPVAVLSHQVLTMGIGSGRVEGEGKSTMGGVTGMV